MSLQADHDGIIADAGIHLIKGTKTCDEQSDRLKAVKETEWAPVRRGRWLAIKEKAPWLICSECGTYLYNEQKSVTKYCYNCGAKMEEPE